MIDNKILKRPKLVGIVFESNGKSFVSKCIRFLTHSKYSHVEFIFEGNITFGSREFDGIKARDIGSFNNPEIFEIVDLCTEKPIEITDEINNKIWDELDKLNGHKYDYLGILGYLFNKPNMHDSDRWFCSELVFYVCKKVGLRLSNRHEDFYVSPSDIANSLRLRPRQKNNNNN